MVSKQDPSPKFNHWKEDPITTTMDKQMKMSIIVPVFDGEDHVLWKIRMTNYLMSIGLAIWELVEEGYKIPQVTPTEAE